MLLKKCPVCDGVGILPHDFYDVNEFKSASSSTLPATCRSCFDSGLITISEEEE
jgi:hypothetical protein